jgi:hypothetical protein
MHLNSINTEATLYQPLLAEQQTDVPERIQERCEITQRISDIACLILGCASFCLISIGGGCLLGYLYFQETKSPLWGVIVGVTVCCLLCMSPAAVGGRYG